MRICWAQYTLWAVIAVLGVASMLAGCGSKGDLYMPAPETETTQPSEQAPQQSEEK